VARVHRGRRLGTVRHLEAREAAADRRLAGGRPSVRVAWHVAAARAAYAAHTGQVVETSGFLVHDTLRAGCSLDGHVGAFAGVVEIKAPNTVTHLRYLCTRRIPTRIRAQITHHLWITDARWCDFVSFDDRLPTRAQLLVVRVGRDQVDIAGYAREAARFLKEVDLQVGLLASLSPVAFFEAAPLDVAQAVLASCVKVVAARRRAGPSVVAPAGAPLELTERAS
jgi:YqaJ-like viral recombinase domain